MKLRLGKMAMSLLSSLSPGLAAGLKTPLAKQAVGLIAGALGLKNPTDKQLDAALLDATPEQIAAIKQAEQDFTVRMAELDIDVFKLETEDVQDAREFAKADMRPQMILSAIYTVGYFGMMAGIMGGWLTVPEGTAGGVIQTLIGILSAGQIKILDFWFGSSHGSKLKSMQKEN